MLGLTLCLLTGLIPFPGNGLWDNAWQLSVLTQIEVRIFFTLLFATGIFVLAYRKSWSPMLGLLPFLCMILIADRHLQTETLSLSSQTVLVEKAPILEHPASSEKLLTLKIDELEREKFLRSVTDAYAPGIAASLVVDDTGPRGAIVTWEVRKRPKLEGLLRTPLHSTELSELQAKKSRLERLSSVIFKVLEPCIEAITEGDARRFREYCVGKEHLRDRYTNIKNVEIPQIDKQIRELEALDAAHLRALSEEVSKTLGLKQALAEATIKASNVAKTRSLQVILLIGVIIAWWATPALVWTAPAAALLTFIIHLSAGSIENATTSQVTAAIAAQGWLSLLLGCLVMLLLALLTGLGTTLWRQNKTIIQQASQPNSSNIYLKAFLHWLPILGAGLLIGIHVGDRLQDLVQRQVYKIPAFDEFTNYSDEYTYCEEDIGFLILREDCRQRDIESDLPLSVALRFKAPNEQVEYPASGEALEYIASRIPQHLGCEPEAERSSCISPAFQVDYDCNFPGLACRLGRLVKEYAGKAYATTRAQILDGLAKGPAIKIEEAQRQVVEIQWQLKSAAIHAMMVVIASWKATNMLLAALLTIAAIKSYLYVLARCLFQTNDQAVRMLGAMKRSASAKALRPSQVTVSAGQSLETACKGRYFVRGGVNPSGKAPKGGIFPIDPTGLAISRVLAGRYFLRHFDLSEKDEAVEFTTTGSRHLIQVILEEGQSVCFHLKNLYAFRGTPRFRLHVSLSVSSIFLGRFLFSTVEGPGTLILETKGRPRSTGTDVPARAFPPRNLVIWDVTSRFRILSEGGFLSIYTGGVQFVAADDTVSVFDADDGNGVSEGAIKFLPSALMPF
jgi:uncharacterized protein (AIM24 family)